MKNTNGKITTEETPSDPGTQPDFQKVFHLNFFFLLKYEIQQNANETQLENRLDLNCHLFEHTNSSSIEMDPFERYPQNLKQKSIDQINLSKIWVKICKNMPARKRRIVCVQVNVGAEQFFQSG